jgi:hypothetical protein
MELYQLIKKIQARRDRRLLYCKKKRQADFKHVWYCSTYGYACASKGSLYSFKKVAKM